LPPLRSRGGKPNNVYHEIDSGAGQPGHPSRLVILALMAVPPLVALATIAILTTVDDQRVRSTAAPESVSRSCATFSGPRRSKSARQWPVTIAQFHRDRRPRSRCAVAIR